MSGGSISEGQAKVFGDTRAQFLKLDDRAPLSVCVGFDHRVLKARHDVLCRIFLDVLAIDQSPDKRAVSEACGVIHNRVMA